MKRFTATEQCWQWNEATDPAGYALYFGNRSVSTYAHRFIWLVLFGETSLEIDHLCRNRSCVNPNHLEPVTRAENNKRAAQWRTHCPQGHPYEGDNIIWYKETSRVCRICHRASCVKHRAKMKAIRAAAQVTA